MKTLAIVMVALGSLLSGCIAVPVEDGRVYSDGRGYHQPYNYDRDGDGVPNRQDRRPDDSRRY
jgi:starvation-inducible outer membrane lipoprotein